MNALRQQTTLPLERRTRAFTLIELLVVIVIIVILAALMFPAFSSVREKSRQVVCLSNLRQMGMAGLLYQKDYNRFPGAFEGIVRRQGVTKIDWKSATIADLTNGTLWPYLRNASVYACPTFRAKCGVPNIVWSYPLNAQLAYDVGGKVISPASVRAPSHLLMFTEENWWKPDYVYGTLITCTINDGAWVPTIISDGTQMDGFGTFHNGSVNAVFLDGHAERIDWHTKIPNPNPAASDWVQQIISYYGRADDPSQK